MTSWYESILQTGQLTRLPSRTVAVRQRERRILRKPPAPLPTLRVRQQGGLPELAPEMRALLEQPPQAAIAPRAGTASFATRSPRASKYPTQAAPPGSFQRRLRWGVLSTGRPFGCSCPARCP